ncbi:hypothetical protein ABIF38_003172 [Bradyrhizobium japonicum]|uniref:Uncharacterized protein n=1 Tax=Bradyrhizobium elkanii TaxID=29448 RepID=A0ABV4FBP4_BRAEL|nr:hypothetical protein [Bradyrhizobium elkanii]MCP1734512.1 hypothetical protein [Bradyrhizobium elkanii]MCP1752306.1 hypothetical protein [Bradyrhizobium elkanii]MCP1978079.1 hypothetical protein [Bradyrhizobium elkanii]MCS3569850.1 hypothetical protein [Bradyrhizobium elkanii]
MEGAERLWQSGLLGEIFAMRQSRPGGATGGGPRQQHGLESDKKTLQVAWVGRGLRREPAVFDDDPTKFNPTRICH